MKVGSASRELELVVRPCPSCGAQGDITGVFVDSGSRRYGLPDVPVPLRRCVACRLRFFDLIEDVNTAGQIYSRMMLSSGAPKRRHFLFRRLIEKLWDSSLGLELGAGRCHVGRLLAPGRHSVIAVDKYDEIPPAHNGIKFISADLITIERAQLPLAHFDWILIDNVLEHLPAFRPVLDCSRAWLKDDGWLLVSVPNGNTLKRIAGERQRAEIYRPVEHVNIFDGRTLDTAIGASGFRRKAIRFVPKDVFESSALASLLGFAPLGLYRAYVVDSFR